MNLSEYSNYDGLGLAQLIKNKDLSAAELAQVAGLAIERLNPTLNAVVDIYPDRLSAVDANTNLDGDFAGVPLLLKDIGATEKNRPHFRYRGRTAGTADALAGPAPTPARQ